MRTEIEKFKTAIRPFIDIWSLIDVRVICIRLIDKWINLGTTIILRSEAYHEINSLEQLPKTEDIMVLNVLLGTNEIDRVLENLSSGILGINNIEIYYGRKQEKEIRPGIHLHFSTQYRNQRLSFPNIDFTTYLLSGTGDTVNELIEYEKLKDLEWKLRAFDAPYDSLDDLAKTFLFHPLDGSRCSYIWVVAPVNARFNHECKIYNNKLQIYLEAFGWPKTEKPEVRCIQHSGNGHISRSSYKLDAKWTSKDKYHILRSELDAKNCREVQLFLILRNVAIEKLTLCNPEIFLRNERVLIHDSFDKGLKSLRKYLNGQGKDVARDFERGVVWLLHLCGFSIISYGFSQGLQNEIDVVAFPPMNMKYIVCIECTIGRPDVKEKLSKLSLRCKELETILKSYNRRILPLIFTSLKSDKIPISEVEKAEKEGVIIVFQERIQELIELSMEPEPLSKVIDYLTPLIPKRVGHLDRFVKRTQK